MDDQLRLKQISSYSIFSVIRDELLRVIGVESHYRELLLSVVSIILNSSKTSEKQDAAILDLTNLCYEAVSGDKNIPMELSAAWTLLFIAAHILDVVEDGEDKNPILVQYGTGVAVNAATGLIFISNGLLNRLESLGVKHDVANDIRKVFFERTLRMSSGQHLDLSYNDPNIETSWGIAGLKSGEFFSLACYAGARLASDDQNVLKQFSTFGHHLGIIKQISDDIEGLSGSKIEQSDFESGKLSIPITYALEHLPDKDVIWLKAKIKTGSITGQDIDVAVGMVERSGAIIYTLLERERHKHIAYDAIISACKDSPARKRLLDIFQNIAK